MGKYIIWATLTLFCVSSFGAWNNDLPADTSTWNNAAGEIRDNWNALEVVFGVDLTGAGVGRAYYQAAAPTTKPDGSTALSADDNGSLWVDSDVSRFDGGILVQASSTFSAILRGQESIFSSYVDASYFVATSTTATSTFAGGL
ncbi:hypothetical protein LCGC14_3104650, partial [marine sediment metagenome]